MTEMSRAATRLLAIVFVVLCGLGLYSKEASADLLYAAVKDVAVLSGTVTYGVEIFDENHDLIGQVIDTPSPTGGFAAGSSGNFYIASGNTIYEFDADGNNLGTFTTSAQTSIQSLSFAEGVLYAGLFDLLSSGLVVQTLDENLNPVAQIPLFDAFVGGLAAGSAGDFYTAQGDTITHFDAALNFFFIHETAGFPGDGLTDISALSFGGGRLYAAMDEVDLSAGTITIGVEGFDENLQQLLLLVQSTGGLAGPQPIITSLAADSGGAFYTATALSDFISAYSSGGALLDHISVSSLTAPDDFHILSIEALSVGSIAPTQTVPEPAALALLAIGLASLGYSRRRKQ